MRLWSADKRGEGSSPEDTPIQASPAPQEAEPLSKTDAPKAGDPTDPLMAAMDKAALALARSLADEGPWTSQKTISFRLVMDWLAKSRRIRTDDGDDELPRGVEAMRDYISDLAGKGGDKAPSLRTKRLLKDTRPVGEEGAALVKALEGRP